MFMLHFDNQTGTIDDQRASNLLDLNGAFLCTSQIDW